MKPAVAGAGDFVIGGFNWFSDQVFYWAITALMLPMIGKLIRERFVARKVKKDMQHIARYFPSFEWPLFQQAVKDCFQRVHSEREETDLSNVPVWMTKQCWQNQQLPRLERCRREGLANVCDIERIYKIMPLKIVHQDSDKEHAHPMVVVSIEARLMDYLEDKQTGKVVEGKKEYLGVKVIWHFTLENGGWKISSMQDDDPQYLTYSQA